MPETMICHECNKKFEASRESNIYCSRECCQRVYARRNKYLLADKRKVYRAKVFVPKEPVPMVCSCGKEFESRRKNNTTCSPKCSQREYREKNKLAIRERKFLWDRKKTLEKSLILKVV